MNSHQAAAAAKEGSPILYTNGRGETSVYRRIKSLTYHYYPTRGVSLLLEDRRFCQCNIYVPLEAVKAISSCDECPNKNSKSKSNCGHCIFVCEGKEDHFICISSNSCTLFENECKKESALCSKYGECKNCMINGDDLCEHHCCDECIYNKEEV